ncbi:hypothetical protein GGTG_01304 [Gaeumannomyces tritici R3-111a-1]|uniref:Uncharacterized protein n=1 Tax=Gaeumannomyces tritici (strain R3-111a-1) TaxID=644352 RepID=J3NJ70_GAET3|nr:hypothetical protein GGTG_01304 [Gaeumannomyces tritici R3-111a-1]EJT81321.1 hypothetical protein GGTG_01304 [Gaeumannomyces tritici R3-111a-1]
MDGGDNPAPLLSQEAPSGIRGEISVENEAARGCQARADRRQGKGLDGLCVVDKGEERSRVPEHQTPAPAFVAVRFTGSRTVKIQSQGGV